jgi:hypothetical protein
MATQRSSTSSAWAIGGMIFAAAMMVMLGIWQIIVAITALVDDEFFVVAPNYTFDLDTTAWGWIHLILGVVVTLTGFALFTGAIWARVIGIIIATVSAIANFFFLPYYPFWAIVIIAIDIFVIWALASAGSLRDEDLVTNEMRGYRDYGPPGAGTHAAQ